MNMHVNLLKMNYNQHIYIYVLTTLAPQNMKPNGTNMQQ